MTEKIMDTDILSYFFKGDKKVVINFERYLEEFSCINITIVTYYEILSGLHFIKANKKLENFEKFCIGCKIFNVSKDSAEIAAKLYANLRHQGTPVDDIDLLIAGIAIKNNFTLVTNNDKDFGRIKTLKTVKWSKVKKTK
jgi:tRNA(fMet)-specific endonuclease VapC